MTGKGVQKEFKRYAYTISDRASNLTLIHYKGDDSIVNENPHVRTCGSVLRELENSTQSPSVVYKKKIVDCSSTMLSPVLLPRNRKQVSNCQHLRRQAFRLSHDALYNLHELSYDIPDFVHKIVTFPDLRLWYQTFSHGMQQIASIAFYIAQFSIVIIRHDVSVR